MQTAFISLLILMKMTYGYSDSTPEPIQGHSSFTDATSLAKCFQPSEILKSKQASVFDTAIWKTMKQVAQTLNIYSYGSKSKFLRDPLSNFIRENDEDDFSISLNLVTKVSHQNQIGYSLSPRDLLSSYAKEFLNRTSKLDFNIICGTHLISGYEEGAALIISFRITFPTLSDKKNFQLAMKLKPLAFLDEAPALDYKGAQITISAFQLGGDPIQLSSVLSISALKCELSKPSQCQESLQALITYAKENFPKQLLSPSEIWQNAFVPIGEYTKGPLLNDIGFEIKPTNFPLEILEARKKLVAEWELYTTYRTFFKMLVNLGIGGNIAESNLKKVETNLAIFDQGLLFGPAIDCWNRPKICQNISTEILSALETVDYDPKSSKLCGRPEDSNITLADACANLKGIYISTIWESGNFMGSSLPDADGMCYAKAVGIKKTLDGYIPAPCGLQAYMPIAYFA